MDTNRINEMIAMALKIEADEHHLAHYLRDRARAKGHELTDQQRQEALELFEKYVRSVPEVLSSATAAAHETPVEDVLERVIRAAVTYWDEPDDLVPDELGLLGLLDDSYFTLRMLQLVSDRLEADTGRPLVADDLSALDGVVREILGEIALVLDQLVEVSLGNAGVDELVAMVAEYSGSFVLQSAQTSFTGLSVAELVETRLSFAAGSADLLRAELLSALEPCARLIRARVEAGDTLVELGEALAEGRTILDRVLHEAEILRADDRDALVNLLLGSLMARAAVGGTLDRVYLAHSVDLVLCAVA